MDLEGIMLSETSQTKTNTSRSHMWNLTTCNDNKSLIKLTEKKDQICGWREMEKGGQHAQTFNYKIKKYHEYNVQRDYR